MSRVVSWYSCGAASAIATKLTLKDAPAAEVVYCETGGEHSDNERFLTDCEIWFGKSITRLRSAKYASTWDVWEDRSYLAGISGAPCTSELKVAPRLAWQRQDDVHVFGYTADKPDIIRANRLRLNYPEMQISTPLIDAGLDKRACIAMIENAGIAVPVMYRLGFQNNNCIPCVKATSPNYWANVRKHFPDEFDRMARLSRHLDVRLTRFGDERKFIDEIPDDHPLTDAIAPSCDFLCHLAEMGLGDTN
jgi:hypothetical protein